MPLSHPQPERSSYLMSPEELSEFLQLGRTSTYGLLSSGAIPCVRFGRLLRVRRSDVEKFVEERLEKVRA
jgi:excisionase family DNA binding protein